ncbi:E3 ubiquitin-protein ligase RNF6-like [Fagus crenata]
MSTTGCATDTTMAGTQEEDEEERQTYWCHECDMSVNLISQSHSQTLLCPHCHSDFLELMDSTITQQQDHTYLFDNPTLHRLFLLHHDHEDFSLDSSSSSLSTITISPSMFDSDPILLCAICKDELLLHSEAKQLPCSHLYHSHCILPWLSSHNSCPLCRFQLPSTSTTTTRKLNFADFLNDHQEQEQDWMGSFTNTLRHIARRHTMMSVDSSSSSTLSPTQMEEETRTGFVQTEIILGAPDEHMDLNHDNAHIILPSFPGVFFLFALSFFAFLCLPLPKVDIFILFVWKLEEFLFIAGLSGSLLIFLNAN